jgi:hypothetical protein
MGEPYVLTPMQAAADVNAPEVADTSRAIATITAIPIQPEAKPTMPNSWDTRQYRRPGVESGHPQVWISPAVVAALGLVVKKPDQLMRQSTGETFRVTSVFPTNSGGLKCNVNLL